MQFFPYFWVKVKFAVDKYFKKLSSGRVIQMSPFYNNRRQMGLRRNETSLWKTNEIFRNQLFIRVVCWAVIGELDHQVSITPSRPNPASTASFVAILLTRSNSASLTSAGPQTALSTSTMCGRSGALAGTRLCVLALFNKICSQTLLLGNGLMVISVLSACDWLPLYSVKDTRGWWVWKVLFQNYADVDMSLSYFYGSYFQVTPLSRLKQVSM